MPRPGALKHTGQAIVGDAVQRVSYSRTGRHVAKIQQGHEVYPQWLRHRVSPPKRESMPVFMRGSTSAYLLSKLCCPYMRIRLRRASPLWPGSNGAITRRILHIVSAEKQRAKESGVVGIVQAMGTP